MAAESWVSNVSIIDQIFKAILSVLIVSIVYLISLVVYRLTLHPLAKYPGPFLAKTSSFYGVYHAYRGDNHLHLYKCHLRYGSVFRYSPNSLSFDSREALQTIHAAKANCQKSRFYEVYPPVPKAWSLVNAIARPIHARKRRVMSQAFSDRAVKDMEDYILIHIRKFTSLLRSSSESRSSLDMALHSDDLLMDIFSELCFSKSYNLQGTANDRSTRTLINLVAKHHYIMGQVPYLDRTPFDRMIMPKLTAGTEKYRAFSRASAMARATTDVSVLKSSERKDIFSHLLSAKDAETGEGLSKTELWAEAGTLIVAGADTSSTCLAATLYYLSRPENKTCLEKLTEELRGTFPDSDVEQIRSGPRLTSCLYLRACIDEALRMSPPVPGLLPREVLQGGMEIDGQHIPAGIDVGVPLYAIHHNVRYFESPFSYRPERWLSHQARSDNTVDKDWESRLSIQQSALAPFLLGPRGCIGKNMAYLELSIAIARTIWAFDVKEADLDCVVGKGWMGEFKLIDQFTADKEGPMLRFTARVD